MKQFLLFIISVVFTSFIGISQVETEFTWPMELEGENGMTTTIYQPQLETFRGNVLTGRMALTVQPKDKDMIFGAVWFKATMETDKEARTVRLAKLSIEKTHFPDLVDEDVISKFSDLLVEEIESWDIVMSLDRLTASLEDVEDLKNLSEQINNDPPNIFLRYKPAMLVMIDGEPILKKDDEAGLEYVVNTPFFIVKDNKGDFYINGGKFWYSSNSMTSGYTETNNIPKSVSDFAKKNQSETTTDSIADTYTEAPEVIVQTKASELIIIDGKIDYKPIDSTTLLFVSNTESDIIMDINSQNHYVLLAGRWYASKLLEDGSWEFVEPDNLPSDFAKIPNNSEISDVLSSIPGTDEAQIALLEQSIPQTATIDRKEASIEVQYDGEPKFETITGTSMKYAVNSDKSVLLIDEKYYAVENGVWFVSSKPSGPWAVSTERPEGVDEIPPESPVYNVKYVYVYDSTPDVVYVGYLPGYTYSYVYGGVVVYGTGYHYDPWYGLYYYPRPVTYGYGVHYNPYTGWGFTIGVSYGWVSWHYHPYYRHSYWGPRGYHHGYRHGYHHGYHRGYHNGYRAGYAAGHRNAQYNNVYKNQRGVKNTGNINRGQGNSPAKNARPSTKPNNMYTDKKGNVYQRDKSGNYNKQSNRPSTGKQPSQKPSQKPSTGQKPTTKPSTRPSTQPSQKPAQRPTTQPSQRPSTMPSQRPATQPSNRQQLNRSANSRNQGNQNHQRQQQQRPTQSRPTQSRPQSRPSGGSGRRR